MYKNKLLFSLIFVSLLSFIWGCKRDRVNPYDPKAVQISEKTKLPEQNPELKKEETQIRGDTLYLIYQTGVTKPTFNPDDIVVGETGEGYLKKVLSSAVSGDTVILLTQQACLTDAVIFGGTEGTCGLMPVGKKMKMGRISRDTILIGKDGKKYHYHIEADAPQISTLKGDLFEIRIPNVEIEVMDGPNLAASVTIDEVVLKEKIDVDFKLIIKEAKVDEFKLIARKTDNVELNGVSMNLELPIAMKDESIKLTTVPLGTTVFLIGFVPVVIIYELGIYAGTNLSIDVSVSTTITNDVDITSTSGVGAIYENGSWSPYLEKTLDGSGDFVFNPSASVSVTNKNYLKASLDAKLYGIAGPSLYAKPYEYNTVSYPPFDFELGIGIGFGLGFKVEILDWNLAEYNYTFVDLKKMLKHSGGGDEGWIFFNKLNITTGERAIWKVHPDGSDLAKVRSGIVYSSDLAGNKLAFVDKVGSEYVPFVMDRDGGNVIQLTTHEAYYPVISPDGQWVCYNWSDTLMIIKSNGTQEHILTGKLDYEEKYDFSGDGAYVAFCENDTLYRINVDGTNKITLSDAVNWSDCYSSGVDWAPSNQYLIFAERVSIEKLWRIEKDGSNKTLLVEGDCIDFSQFSPGANLIGFTDEEEVYVINLDGSSKRNVTTNETLYACWGFVFSPDDKEIAYIAWDDPNWPQHSYLRVVDIENLNIRTLAETSGGQEIILMGVWVP